ncbi:MAG: trypsin-like peptidase domain-containing protein [bacterium]
MINSLLVRIYRQIAIYIAIIISIFNFSYSSEEIQKIVEYNKPAVVLIYMHISGTVTFFEPSFNMQALQELEFELRELIDTGVFGETEDEARPKIKEYIISKIASNPKKYFIPSAKKTVVNVNTGGMGTGVIINSNGYILTATHVVEMEEEELRQVVVSEFLLGMILDYFIPGLETLLGESLDQEDYPLVEKMVLAYVSAYPNSFALEPQKRIYAGLGVAEKGKSNVGAFFKPASVIRLGSSEKVSDIVNMGRDIAVIKIDQTNLPVSIVSEQEPAEGSEVVIVGYPGNVHYFAGELFEHFSILKPTITKGIVSAIRTSNKGVRVIQTDATISKGNSGGPAYSKTGKIIGTASWSIKDPVLQTSVKNYGILVSCAEIKNFLKEVNVENKLTEIDTNYQKGVDEYFAQKYRNALRYFKKVQELYPDHPYVKDYIINCQTYIDQGKDRSGISLDNNMILILIGLGVLACGGLMLIIAAAVAYFVFFRPKAPNMASYSSTPTYGRSKNIPPNIRPE